MATVRDICSMALRRLRMIGAGEDATEEDAAIVLDQFNEMLHGWRASGVDVALQADFVLNDEFVLFCPPADALGATLAALSYQGTWNASTNSPSLTSGSGTQGYLYKVSVAGTTTLDSVTSWAVNDYALFDASTWLKSRPVSRHQGAIVDNLAMAVADDFGKEPGPSLVKRAQDGWRDIQADFVRVDEATYEPGLRYLPSRRYYGIIQ